MFATMQTDAACGESISSTRLNRICHLMTTFFRAPSNLVLVVMMVMICNITMIIIIIKAIIFFIIIRSMRGWQNMTTAAISLSGAISPMFALLFDLNVQLQTYLYLHLWFLICFKCKAAVIFVFVRAILYLLQTENRINTCVCVCASFPICIIPQKCARYRHWIAVFP